MEISGSKPLRGTNLLAQNKTPGFNQGPYSLGFANKLLTRLYWDPFSRSDVKLCCGGFPDAWKAVRIEVERTVNPGMSERFGYRHRVYPLLQV